MTAVCLRCDWEGAGAGTACPRCGAPLYRPVTSSEPRRAAAARRTEEAPIPGPPAARPMEGERELRPVRAPTSARAAVAIVLVAFAAIAVTITAGGSERRRPVAAPTSSSLEATGGILVYSVADGSGAARLWLWHLQSGEVAEGPLIRHPLELISVRSPGYGWLAFTSDVGNGTQEAAVLDSFAPAAEEDPIGRGDIVAWGRDGGTAILVKRGPVLGGCRRVRIVAVNVDIDGGESVLDDRICGDVLSVGRTSLGYFVTTERRGVADVVAADVVGAGYDDAGLLLADHGVIAIAPSGEMLVTPSSEFLPRSGEVPPIAGEAWYFRQFGGRAVPYVAEGSPLRVDRVLAYAPGSVQALAIGRLPGEDPGLWELPLGVAGEAPRTARFVGVVRGSTDASYASDGTAFVVTGGRLWEVRDHRMEPLDLPEGSPAPTGPLAWIVREPLTEI
jgi:hypothetical protein